MIQNSERMKSAVMARFSHGSAAKRLSPAAPNATASVKPTAVKVRTMPRPYTSACVSASAVGRPFRLREASARLAVALAEAVGPGWQRQRAYVFLETRMNRPGSNSAPMKAMKKEYELRLREKAPTAA